MKKIIAFVAVNLIAIITIIAVVGAFSETVRGVAIVKFDGVLERDVEIKVLENDTALKQGYLKELLAGFNEEYKEYNIKAVDAKMGEYTDLAGNGPFGYGPDVVYQANDQLMKYVYGHHIMPLPIDEIEATEKISDEAKLAFRSVIGGTEYNFAVPVNVQGPLLYYRKDLIPLDWKETWDNNKNEVPDMLESWNAMYRFSQFRRSKGSFGYMKSMDDQYFAIGYLYSYGAYSFGNNNTNPEDIGHSKGEAEKGLSVIRQLASVMNEGCIDDTITVNAYGKIGSGEYFATMTTPDVYTLFIDEISVKNGISKSDAANLLGVAPIPMLPKSGDLSEENPELIPSRMMGGVHGYAVSAYAKAPNAALAFVKYATSYKMIKRRNELLGIVPARMDVAKDIGGISEVILNTLNEGNTVIMPSIKESAQMWSPLKNLFADVAKDPFRSAKDQRFTTIDILKQSLVDVDKQIYDTIYALQ